MTDSEPDVPTRKPSPSQGWEIAYSSPRRNLLKQAAASTLGETDTEPPHHSKWQGFRQPLPLILQTFQEMTEKNEDFWFHAAPFFQRKVYSEGSVVFKIGVSSVPG
jgi:SulP family sulfate permease